MSQTCLMQPGPRRRRVILIGSFVVAAGTFVLLLWGFGVFGTEDPLHPLGFVGAAAGVWLVVNSIRHMLSGRGPDEAP